MKEARLLLPMHKLNLIYLRFIQLIGRARLLPQTIAIAVRQQQGRGERDKLEAERLDRLRNPSKYLGR
jgi:hypothetical protein